MKKIHAQVEILDQEELVLLHQATLEVLSEVGCRLPNRKLLERLSEAGAQVDFVSARVRFPQALVESSLEKAKRTNAALGWEPHTLLGRNRFRLHPGNQANIVDYGAAYRRQGTTEDVVKGIVLCNELPYIGSCMPLVTPTDIPPYLQDAWGYALCTFYSRKPYSVYILSPETARLILRIYEIAREDPGRKEDSASVGYLLEPNGSLSYDELSLEMLLVFAEAGHGVAHGPMAMAGLDAPVTLPGTLVIQNAHNLIGLVLTSLLDLPGGWSGSAHTFDLRHTICSFGSPNQVLIGWAAIQLGRFYGFDVHVNSALTDACLPDFQGGFEKGMSAMAALLGGAAGIGAQGIVGADQATSFEQLVIDNEWASAIDHLYQLGFEVTPDTLAVDVIKEVGIGGSYLAEAHTVRRMRDTYWPAKVFNQRSWDAWFMEGGKDCHARAHERVEEILAAHYPPPLLLTRAAQAEINGLFEEARRSPERFETEHYLYR
jgi:trimethylamine--corrinoid protein Co-methyltransferase